MNISDRTPPDLSRALYEALDNVITEAQAKPKPSGEPNGLQAFYHLQEDLLLYTRKSTTSAFLEAYRFLCRAESEEDLAIMFLYLMRQASKINLDLPLMVDKIVKYAALTKAKDIDGLWGPEDMRKIYGRDPIGFMDSQGAQSFDRPSEGLGSDFLGIQDLLEFNSGSDTGRINSREVPVSDYPDAESWEIGAGFPISEEELSLPTPPT